jgi:hypothetical protein
LAVALAAPGGVLSGAGSTASGSAVAIFPSGDEVVVELAVDDATRARGYMFRDEIGPNEGMLFVFDEADRHSFWMKNCRVALDLIWLDESFRVVHQARDQEPCPSDGPCPSILPFRSARYVLEVAAGGARRVGLEDGDHLVVLWD